jgi:hypothetical protein
MAQHTLRATLVEKGVCSSSLDTPLSVVDFAAAEKFLNAPISRRHERARENIYSLNAQIRAAEEELREAVILFQNKMACDNDIKVYKKMYAALKKIEEL